MKEEKLFIYEIPGEYECDYVIVVARGRKRADEIALDKLITTYSHQRSDDDKQWSRHKKRLRARFKDAVVNMYDNTEGTAVHEWWGE